MAFVVFIWVLADENNNARFVQFASATSTEVSVYVSGRRGRHGHRHASLQSNVAVYVSFRTSAVILSMGVLPNADRWPVMAVCDFLGAFCDILGYSGTI